MRKLFATISLAASLAAWAVPSQRDVEQAVAHGDYAKAETMMRDVVAGKPGSAKARYVFAEVLAHNGHFKEATNQALQAKKLDPDIHFTSPDKFRAFEAKLLNAGDDRP